MALVSRHENRLFWVMLTLSLLFWGALIAVTLGLALIYVLLALLVYLFVQSAFIAYLQGTAVRISATQYADLQQLYQECCDRLELSARPKLYLLHDKGVFNALAARFLGRQFVVLYADMVDALEAHKDSIRFYIGHELAHIQHRHLLWRPLLFPASLLPLLGAAYARACETTCDNTGVHCCRNANDAAFALAAVATGARRWSTISIDEYAAQVTSKPGFWMSFHELISDHAWLATRVLRVRAQAAGRELVLPRRNPWAWLLALCVPRLGLGGSLPASMVVLAVIGILAAIAVPAYQDYVIRAKVTNALAQAGKAKLKVARYIARTHKAPSSNVAVGMSNTSDNDVVSALIIGPGGTITIEFAELSSTLRNRNIILEPQVVDQRFLWICNGGNLEQKYRPPRCR